MSNLRVGDRLGPYEITGLLGAGGMGEVYRARDTRLGRDVALKVLPAEAAGHDEWRQRFGREARAASALSHPNIATIHDCGGDDDRAYIVMEYVEGETLASRITDRPLPTREIVDVGLQIAEALEEAHARSIIHRDIKPANIMVTPRGRIKVLDFGIARIQSSPAATTIAMTRPGTVVGTWPYMSPEQAIGREVDARSDLFSLGAVMYEMATGRRAFAGETAAETTDRILHRQPTAIARLNDDVPEELERIVGKCLEKDLDRRYHSATDLVVDLKNLKRDLETGHSDPAARFQSRRSTVLLSVAVAAVLLAAAVVAVLLRTRSTPAAQMILDVLPPESVALSNSIALSPDGSLLAFTAAGDDGSSSVWLRSIGSESVQRLQGTEGALYPFWSPDSRSLGFFAGEKLKRLDLEGGPVRPLADAPSPRGGTWGSGNTIVFVPSGGGVLHSVPAGGGADQPVTALDAGRQEIDHRWPVFLPDGSHVLFMARSSRAGSTGDALAVAAVTARPGAHRILTNAMSSGFYLDGHVFFVRGRTLLMQPFDLNRLEMRGNTPSAVRTDVWRAFGWAGLHGCTAAAAALIACRTGATETGLVWVDRSGAELAALDARYTANPELSPDDSVLAFGMRDDESDHDVLALEDLIRGATRRLTERNVEQAVWAPDGRSLVFAGESGSTFDLYRQETTPGAREELLLHSDNWKFPLDWSRDGKWLLYSESSRMAALSLPDRQSVPLACAGATQGARFSPDGRWIAYVSLPSAGRSNIYVCPFRGGGEPWKVSSAGGTEPRWRADGGEIYFVSADRRLMAVGVEQHDGVLRFTRERQLFDRRTYDAGYAYSYDVTARGDRFLITQLRDRGRITVMLNWRPK